MENTYHKYWPKVKISVDAYINEIRNYRYHWHENEQEIDILLKGKCEFIRGGKRYTMEPDDVIIISPGIGHASYSLEEDTYALAIRISTEAFDVFHDNGTNWYFNALTDASSRNDPVWKTIRYYSTLLVESLAQKTKAGDVVARASLELLSALMAEKLEHTERKVVHKQEEQSDLLRKATIYIENNYSDKVALDDLCNVTGYSHTYMSEIFKDTFGIQFHDYLQRIRFQNALYDLANSNLNLTEISFRNGFPDIRTFNKTCIEYMDMTPNTYRKWSRHFSHGEILMNQRKTLNPGDPLIHDKLQEYRSLFF